MKTEILKVDVSKFHINSLDSETKSLIDGFTLDLEDKSIDAAHLYRAADELRNSDIPVAFPTETVYGLGADATRSSAVRGIYKAKQRPSDNPLIVHVHSLQQLRTLLRPSEYMTQYQENGFLHGNRKNKVASECYIQDPIPTIYQCLIRRFWPGPLTLIMPNPKDSVLAPEVTAGLPTFGVRMPRNLHALALLKLADVPLAAPSANASTKPSPTEAEHVKYDLDGRISTIIDGGPCDVGVESTVVDGLSNPPAVLRPGGISIEELRSCPGWENVTVGYKDNSESSEPPRAPGMKYRHYSPKAPVILFEYGRSMPGAEEIGTYLGSERIIGVIRTFSWPEACGLAVINVANGSTETKERILPLHGDMSSMSPSIDSSNIARARRLRVRVDQDSETIELWDVDLEPHAEMIARGLFAALRELDKIGVDAILVEGVDDHGGNVSAAVMNRLRKAAEIKISG